MIPRLVATLAVPTTQSFQYIFVLIMNDHLMFFIFSMAISLACMSSAACRNEAGDTKLTAWVTSSLFLLFYVASDSQVIKWRVKLTIQSKNVLSFQLISVHMPRVSQTVYSVYSSGGLRRLYC